MPDATLISATVQPRQFITSPSHRNMYTLARSLRRQYRREGIAVTVAYVRRIGTVMTGFQCFPEERDLAGVVVYDIRRS